MLSTVFPYFFPSQKVAQGSVGKRAFFFIFFLGTAANGVSLSTAFSFLWLSFVSRDYQKNGGLSGFFFLSGVFNICFLVDRSVRL